MILLKYPGIVKASWELLKHQGKSSKHHASWYHDALGETLLVFLAFHISIIWGSGTSRFSSP